jgi:ketosteroid isomerase-like protein
METAAAAERWVDGWTRGWRAHDPAPIAALYHESAVVRTHPFRDPVYGPEGIREYAREAFADEDEVEFGFHEPLVGDDGRAAVEYWAHIRSGGQEQTLLGVSVLRFDEDGSVLEHRDYWALEDGLRPVSEP